jgi:predicted GNAT family acetyltransferase
MNHMQLFTYNDIDDFLSTTQPILELEEAANNVMLGSCLRLKKRLSPKDPAPFLATVKDSHDKIALIAVMTIPLRVIVYDTPTSDTYEALEILANHVFRFEPNLSTVMAKPKVSRKFAEMFSKISGKKLQIQFEHRAFELQDVIHPTITQGHLEQATPEDLELVTQWNYSFVKEALYEDDLPRARESAKRKIREKEIYLWIVGKPVSMAGSARPTENVIAVNTVYTPPENRGNGYASACVATLSQKLLDSGYKSCVLFTDLANPTSNKIYQNIGYKPVADFTAHEFID